MFCVNFRASIGNSWLGLAYIFSNYVVVVLGIWAEHDKVSPVPVQMVHPFTFYY